MSKNFVSAAFLFLLFFVIALCAAGVGSTDLFIAVSAFFTLSLVYLTYYLFSSRNPQWAIFYRADFETFLSNGFTIQLIVGVLLLSGNIYFYMYPKMPIWVIESSLKEFENALYHSEEELSVLKKHITIEREQSLIGIIGSIILIVSFFSLKYKISLKQVSNTTNENLI